MVQWLKLPALKVGNRGLEPKLWPLRFNIVGRFRDREVACSVSDRQGSNFDSSVCGAVSSRHPQVLLAQFSLYLHNGGLKPHSFQSMARNRRIDYHSDIIVEHSTLFCFDIKRRRVCPFNCSIPATRVSDQLLDQC